MVALEALPDAYLGVGAAQTDDVARRVHEGRHLAVVRQDGVGAGAGQQVPQAYHAVLEECPHKGGEGEFNLLE